MPCQPHPSHDASSSAVPQQLTSAASSVGSAASNATASASSATSNWWQLAAEDVGGRWNQAAFQAEKLAAQARMQAKVIAKKGIKIPGGEGEEERGPGAACAGMPCCHLRTPPADRAAAPPQPPAPSAHADPAGMHACTSRSSRCC